MPLSSRLLLSLSCSAALWALLPASANAATETFLPTGAEQTFTVPAGVTTVRVIAVGGKGGTGQATTLPGGFGAVAIGNVPVTPGDTLYVNVGGNGADSGEGGFNGGGDGGTPAGARGGGGGGASDVRTISSSAGGTSLFSRLVVAGGGGGSGGYAYDPVGGRGGDAGEAGEDGNATGGGPGTQTAGGAGGPGGCDGQPGQRGMGGDSVGGACTGGPPGTGGGGGGGLFGGGGGGTSSSGAGGGGGSSGFAPEVTNTSVEIDTTGSPAISLVYDVAPAFGADTEVSLALAKKRIGAKAAVPVTVTNDNGFAITGSLSAKATDRAGAGSALRAGARAPFEVGAGSSETVGAKLSRKLKRQLKRKGKLALDLTATVRDPAGNSRTVTEKVTVKLKS